ncbi:lysis protein [Acinetobacter phage AP205]|uniref:Lysis protein n=1 Tax=Acinetobacter phage AP205 TaxID=154784 RepID=Q9AZ45_9VIRU|nr:lysis protein [Acinetobacter phage AP205]AAK20387.1 lysis protein [Acinetobacter phage AP205]
MKKRTKALLPYAVFIILSFQLTLLTALFMYYHYTF